MFIRGRLVWAAAGMRPRGAAGCGWAGALRPGGLIPIMLALYLTPALLAVLLVSGVGVLVLAIARTVTSFLCGRESWPRGPFGPAGG